MIKGFNYSIPLGMIFQKHYCSKCGEKLKKEKTHRVVSKDDKDYYRYHDYGSYPKIDYNVYEYIFLCPSCQTRITYHEQRVIKKIQKIEKSKILSKYQLQENFQKCKKNTDKKQLYYNIMTPLIITLVFFIIAFLFTSKTLLDLILFLLLFIFLNIITITFQIKAYKGTGKLKRNKRYSFETENQLKKLHTYSFNNRSLVEISDRCFCYGCKSILNSREITEYASDSQTAICPKCQKQTIIPDSIDDEINKEVNEEMHKYWF